MDAQEGTVRRIVGGVDTHKDLHVAAVVDEQDRVLGTQSFATTRQGYRQMLAWMRSFGEVQRVGVESTGSYGAGLLALPAAGRDRGARGHHARPAGSAPAWQERRFRRPECGACGLCRHPNRDARKAGTG